MPKNDVSRWKRWLLFFVLSFPSVGMAGQTPVCVNVPAGKNQDFTRRFKAAIEKNIALSDMFMVWKGAPFDIPKNGVLVDMDAIHVSAKIGGSGWAITLIIQLPSSRERGYFKQLGVDQYTFGENAPVADEALDFLTDLRERLAAMK